MRTNRRSFAAIYLAFIGRDSGPRAGWLLASLDKDFVVKRLLDAADATSSTSGGFG
jgi:lysyl-tRNA synthetase class 1